MDCTYLGWVGRIEGRLWGAEGELKQPFRHKQLGFQHMLTQSTGWAKTAVRSSLVTLCNPIKESASPEIYLCSFTV